MTAPPIPPTTADELRAEILKRYDGLSKRLQQIARYVLDEPNELALETLAVIADRSGVQPSAIVRFAKGFGFDGASQMQRLFRDGLLLSLAALGYSERVRNFTRAAYSRRKRGDADLLAEFIEGNILALQSLAQTIGDKDLATAAGMLEQADTVFVVGFRRAFPVSSYLAYSLQQTSKRTILVTGLGGMDRQQMQTATPDDLLIAVSCLPYAEETIQAVEAASSAGAKVLSISDSPVSPIAKLADLSLQVRESDIRSFPSLSASICLAQALVTAFDASRKDAGKGRKKRRAAE